MMYEASNNGILEIEEFQEWFDNYNIRLFGLFAKKEEEIINSLKKDTHIYHRITRDECMYTYVLDDKIREDSIQLYGLKKYLEEFSRMDSKEIMELPLWEEYMMFAYLFGITDKISKQLVKLYPDMEENDEFDMLK